MLAKPRWGIRPPLVAEVPRSPAVDLFWLYIRLLKSDNGSMKILIPFLLICSFCCATAVYAADEAALNRAMRSFNGRAKTEADAKLMLNAISQQTKVPEKTLAAQMKMSRLNYAELLAAESLAEGSGKNLNSIVALQRGGKGWAAISNDVKVDSNSIVARLNNAEKMVQAGQPVAPAVKGNTAPLPGYTDIRRVPVVPVGRREP